MNIYFSKCSVTLFRSVKRTFVPSGPNNVPRKSFINQPFHAPKRAVLVKIIST